MRTRVREITLAESAAWDSLIHSSRQGAVFSLYGFSAMWFAVDPALSVIRLGCYDDRDQLIGGLIIPRRKLFGIWIDYHTGLPCYGSPILSASIQDNCMEAFEVLSALARASLRYVPFLIIECSPNLQDVRAFLQSGWTVQRTYTHIWDLEGLDAVYTDMGKRKRFISQAQGKFLFARESADTAIEEFIRLYEQIVSKYTLPFGKTWINSFRQRILWMENNDLFRIYTYRTKTGELVGASTSILSRLDSTVYTWLLAYDYSNPDKQYTPALYWYLAQDLASEFRYLDFGLADSFPLYSFKDSLATKSIPLWSLETKSERIRLYVGNRYREVKRALAHILHRDG